MEYYSGIKRNEIGSFVETWIELETVRKKTKYCILSHICGIWKNGRDDLICKAEIDTWTYM